jgi:hypothetical protein
VGSEIEAISEKAKVKREKPLINDQLRIGNGYPGLRNIDGIRRDEMSVPQGGS